MANHKHHDLIIAWAKGAKIELLLDSGRWVPTEPGWSEDLKYRIKPKDKIKKYRFAAQWDDGGNGVTSLVYTDAEFAAKKYPNGVRLDWTMIEVEVD